MSVIRWKFEDYWATRDKQSTFLYTGSSQFFTVPDGVEQLEVWARGAYGGGLIANGLYLGDYVHGILPVTPGEQLQINVGGVGNTHDAYHGGLGGWNGGGRGGTGKTTKNGGDGGGGATDVRRTGFRILSAGGGAGNSGQGYRGGPGGPNGFGAYGTHGTTSGYGGHGGTQTTGGLAGLNNTKTTRDGASLQGGDGADSTTGHGAGGGGGGLYGGGGGGRTSDGAFAYGGGGGSSFIGNLDDTQPIANERGPLAQSKGELRQPSLQLVYALEPSSYTFEINPNDGGTPSVQKNITASQSTGPNRNPILQEGNSAAPQMPFSGVILTQEHLEALETWFDRRVFIKLTDDLGREFYGVFSRLDPRRVRRASNFWYHTFDAELTIAAYRNASGQWMYGRIA